jgi:arabinogalactan oligomer/maltooligosaccharide transport system permease protein
MKKYNSLKKLKNWWVHLILIIGSIIAVFPILWLCSTSLKPERFVFVSELQIIPKEPTLDNYLHVLIDKEIRNPKEKSIYLDALKNIETKDNADGTIDLYITELIGKGDTPSFFISSQKRKIKTKYLKEIINYKNMSNDNDVRILFKLRPGSDPIKVAKKLYNKLPDYKFFRWILNSLIVTLFTTFLGLFFSATTAYAFSRFNFWGKKVGLFAFLITQMFPGALLVVPLYNIMVTFKLLDTYAGLILAYCTVALPFSVWMLKGFFDTIPKEIEEAAFVEGLSPVGTFYRIIIPLSIPGLAVVTFFNFITAWNEYMLAMTFMQSDRMYTIPVGLTTYVHQFATSWHYMAAAAILITLPVLIIFFIAQKYLVSGLTTGGVKG